MEKLFLFCCLIKCLCINNHILQVKQGVSGIVYQKSGNSMPSPDHPAGKGMPVSRTVLVYELTQRNEDNNIGTLYNDLKTKMIAKTQSAEDGSYKLALPVGRYSVFILVGSQLYANTVDGQGSINPVEVKRDSITKLDITVSNRAMF